MKEFISSQSVFLREFTFPFVPYCFNKVKPFIIESQNIKYFLHVVLILSHQRPELKPLSHLQQLRSQRWSVQQVNGCGKHLPIRNWEWIWTMVKIIQRTYCTVYCTAVRALDRKLTLWLSFLVESISLAYIYSNVACSVIVICTC